MSIFTSEEKSCILPKEGKFRRETADKISAGRKGGKDAGLIMRLNTKCSIAVHALILTAEFESDCKITSELLAKSIGCNSSAVRSILNALQKAGILSIVRGIGGAHLEKSPAEVTLWDIYFALEPDGLAHMIGIHPNPSQLCPVGHNIETILSEPYGKIAGAVKDTMQEITLQQMLDRYHRLVSDSGISAETAQ